MELAGKHGVLSQDVLPLATAESRVWFALNHLCIHVADFFPESDIVLITCFLWSPHICTEIVFLWGSVFSYTVLVTNVHSDFCSPAPSFMALWPGPPRQSSSLLTSVCSPELLFSPPRPEFQSAAPGFNPIQGPPRPLLPSPVLPPRTILLRPPWSWEPGLGVSSFPVLPLPTPASSCSTF